MDLTPFHLAAIYLLGLVLISVGVGFFDWRLGLVAFGVGLVAPVVTFPDEVKR